jgi:hypothetical protein
MLYNTFKCLLLYIILNFKKALIINLAHKHIKHAESCLQSAKAQVYVLNRQDLIFIKLSQTKQLGTAGNRCLQGH